MKRMLSEENFNVAAEDDIMCMAVLRGSKVVIEPNGLDFSFYFSQREGQHGIRVKPMFHPNKLLQDATGVLHLHGDWKFVPGKNDKHISSKQVTKMKNFFRKYKVLFSAVWESVLPEDVVEDYFRGRCNLHDVIEELDCYSENTSILDDVTTVAELEDTVREHCLFNMND